MSEYPLPQSVIQWLEAATEGLPPHRAQAIRKELLAHYEDAVEDYLLLGKSEVEALRQAQIDLGDSAAVNREFNNLYRGRRRYFTALFLAFVTLWVAIGLTQMLRALGVEDLTVAGRLLHALGLGVNLALVLYILLTLKQLLNWQFNLSALDQPIAFIKGSVIVGVGSAAVLELIISAWDPRPTPFNMDTVPETVVVLAGDMGYLALGLGLFWMAHHLLKTRVNLYGLGKILAAGAVMMGAGIWGMTFATYLDQTLALMIGYLIVTLGNLVVWPALSMLFFRAAYRAPEIAFRNA